MDHTSDITENMSNITSQVKGEKSKQVFVTKMSSDSYTPTSTVSLRIKRIVEKGKTADDTIKSLENSIIRCTTSVESVQVPFSTFRDLWDRNKTEATDFGFKLKQKPSDTITITIFVCKYCFDAYGESDLTDMSTATIISDISVCEWKDRGVELVGNITYNMIFSIDQVRDIDIAVPKPQDPEGLDQHRNLDIEGNETKPSDEPSSRQRRAIGKAVSKGLRSFAKDVGKGVAVEVTKDWTLQMLGRGSQNFQEIRKAMDSSDTLNLTYNCKIYGIKPDGKLSSKSEIVVSSNGREDRFSMEFALANLKNSSDYIRATAVRGKITDHVLLAIRKCVMCTPENEYIAKAKVPTIQYIATQEESTVKKLLSTKDTLIGKKQRVLLDGLIPTYIDFSLNLRRINS